MFKRKQQVRSLLTVAVPVLAVTFTYVTLPARKPIAVGSAKKSTEQKISQVIDQIRTKETIVEDLLSERISIEQAFDLVQFEARNYASLNVGLEEESPQRSLEELAAISLTLHLSILRDSPRSESTLAEARCEFEKRYGPQVWVQGPFGICPYPVE